MCARRIEIIERLGHAQVGIRIVVLGKFFALIAQIRFDLELGPEPVFQSLTQAAAELFFHLIVGNVGDVADHARDR